LRDVAKNDLALLFSSIRIVFINTPLFDLIAKMSLPWIYWRFEHVMKKKRADNSEKSFCVQKITRECNCARYSPSSQLSRSSDFHAIEREK
jgi:hypothetical protein